MGGGGSTPYKGECKQVVVIGGGHAGVEVAKQLASCKSSLKITLISDKEYLDWNFGSPRGIVDPTVARAQCFPLAETLAFFSKDIVLKVAQVQTITPECVKTADGEEVPFDFAVVCTGASYAHAMPWKAAVGEKTFTDRAATMQGWHDKVAAAKHIVVAGAGIVGVEVAAELGYAYQDSDKTITLVGSMLKQVPSLKSRATSVLAQYKVMLMEGRTGQWNEGDTKVSVSANGSDSTVECDLLLPCTGLEFGSSLMSEHFSEALQSGRIKCHDSLIVNHANNGNVFACGDVIAIPEGRFSAAAPASVMPKMAKVIVDNILHKLNQDGKLSKYEFAMTASESPCLISLGPKAGAGAICPCCCCSNCLAAKMKSPDGFISVKAKEFGKGQTWTDATYQLPPGAAKS